MSAEMAYDTFEKGPLQEALDRCDANAKRPMRDQLPPEIASEEQRLFYAMVAEKRAAGTMPKLDARIDGDGTFCWIGEPVSYRT